MRRRPVVLLVEDNDDTREALARLLRVRGYDAVEVDSADDGLKRLDSGLRPAAIVLDLRLPGTMDGYGFRASQIADDRLARIPVVVYSAQPMATMPDVAAFVRKDDDPEALLAAIDAIVGRDGSRRI